MRVLKQRATGREMVALCAVVLLAVIVALGGSFGADFEIWPLSSIAPEHSSCSPLFIRDDPDTAFAISGAVGILGRNMDQIETCLRGGPDAYMFQGRVDLTFHLTAAGHLANIEPQIPSAVCIASHLRDEEFPEAARAYSTMLPIVFGGVSWKPSPLKR